MFRPAKHITLWLLFALMCTSCTGVHDLREARSTVAAADSLRAAGQAPYTLNRSNSSNLSNGSLTPDSTALAFAVTTLEPVRLLFPTDYAHANYYYGRLLREAGDHPEAMLAFLRAVHSRTEDHVIKGRSWSNIANMCRCAAKHALAYDIYLKAADEFLLSNDSTNYFYVTNSRAYECAEMYRKDSAFCILKIIDHQCQDSDVISRTLETKAEACFRVGEYDSVLHYITQTYPPFSEESSNLLLRAQAYFLLNEVDPAIFYAKKVIEQTHEYADRYNALYILSYGDKKLPHQEFLSFNSERFDIQMEHSEILADLSQAILLLQQDLERKPDLTWLWSIVVTIIILTIANSTYTHKRKTQRKLLSQQISEQREQSKALSLQIADKKKQHEILQHEELELQQKQDARMNEMRLNIENTCKAIRSSNTWKEDIKWKDFDSLCDFINSHFFLLADKLKATELLDEREIRLCFLVLFDFSPLTYIADIINYSNTGIRTYKSRVNKNLGNAGHDLREFLIKLALGKSSFKL